MQLRESSRVVTLWRATISGSSVVKAIGPRIRPLGFLGRDLQRDVTSAGDGGVVQAIDGSTIMQTTARLLARIDGDRRRSIAAHVASALRSQILSMPLWQRIRSTALTMFTAVVVHVLLTRFSAPEPTGMARAVWMGIGSVLAAVMVGAHQVAAAWVDWSSRGRADDESERE